MGKDFFPDCGSKKPREKAHEEQHQEVEPGHLFYYLPDIERAQLKKNVEKQNETDKSENTNKFILLYHLEMGTAVFLFD